MDIPMDSKIKSDNFYDDLSQKLASSNDRLKVVSRTIEQSQSELTKLTQKTSQVSAQLQKFQGNLNQITREEIRDSYTEAMDAQQRLLVMRGQLERLTEQKNQLQAFINYLEEIRAAYASDSKENDSRMSKSRNIETLEMLITAQEAERQSLARQMHDGPAQALSNFIVQAEIATKLFEIDPSKVKDELEKLKSSAMYTFHKVRNFVAEIRPMMLDDLGLIPTLKKHVATIKEETGTNLTLTINGGEKKLESYLEVFIFRTTQELISNAMKRNANLADLQINVELTLENSRITLTVVDNGKEFTAEQLKTEDGLGIDLIEARVKLLGGSFDIKSNDAAHVNIVMGIPVHETLIQ